MRQRTLLGQMSPYVAAGAAALVVALLPPFHAGWVMVVAAVGVVVGTMAVVALVSRRLVATVRRREQALREAEARFRSAFDFVPAGMAIFALDGRFLQVNDAYCRLTGYTRQQLLGMTFLELTHPEDREHNAALEKELRAGTIPYVTFERRYVHADGRSVWVSASVSLVRDESDRPMYGVMQVQDVSDRVVLLDRLNEMARTDDLTGLLNRRAWFQELRMELARARRNGQPLCVALLDVDHFKLFNDANGHQRGDDLLKAAALAWRGSCRETDVLARYGGEEFILALPGCGIEDAQRLAERMRRVTPLGQTLSVGIAQWDGRESAEHLIDRADAALYDAKRDGRDRVATAA
jgi:diguanylate cyclase (GGDEF)-like protein/PAS domain S-box-containing protein